MSYKITFYTTTATEGIVTEAMCTKLESKIYDTLEELLEKELGCGEVDEIIEENICDGSWSVGISYDRNGNITELDSIDDRDRFDDYDGRKVEALDGKLVFDCGYPPAFCIEDCGYLDYEETERVWKLQHPEA
jgi:hypothetical protein